MIDYKLARKLKDAGFPQEVKDGQRVYVENGTILFVNDTFRTYQYDYMKIPTLSELIEETKQKGRTLNINECQEWWGHEIDEKTHLLKKDKKGKIIPKLLKEYRWEAKMKDWNSKEYGGRRCSESGDEIVARAEGETPEIAMSNLYIKLNEQRNKIQGLA